MASLRKFFIISKKINIVKKSFKSKNILTFLKTTFRKTDMKQLFPAFYWKHFRVLNQIGGISFLEKWNIWKIEIMKQTRLCSQVDLNSLKNNAASRYIFICFSWGIGNFSNVFFIYFFMRLSCISLTKSKYLIYCFYCTAISWSYSLKFQKFGGMMANGRLISKLCLLLH